MRQKANYPNLPHQHGPLIEIENALEYVGNMETAVTGHVSSSPTGENISSGRCGWDTVYLLDAEGQFEALMRLN
jgi:hypothetical protein